ncbi:unnamed protein product [Oikopleura dioica]|uniref:DNA-directed RNA polymerase I subunit RPA12 n=1 Tax=Oikopleura dioica TaxID=34765 RepID=E4XCE0_OIKDI|nr:unnamed protein product [Oikopleura dioica]
MIIRCKACPFKAPAKIYHDSMLNFSEVIINYPRNYYKKKDDGNLGQETSHLCSKCGHMFAWLKTMQLRSADEGQTCFYRCQKCQNIDKEDG